MTRTRSRNKFEKTTIKRGYYGFKFTFRDFSSICFTIGAFSLKEVYSLAWKGFRKLCLPEDDVSSKTYFTVAKPDNCPEDKEESFVMYQEKILRI